MKNSTIAIGAVTVIIFALTVAVEYFDKDTNSSYTPVATAIVAGFFGYLRGDADEKRGNEGK